MKEPQYTAVRMYAPCKPPRYRECKVCKAVLQYWQTSRGYKYVCFHCKKVEVQI